jgi:hypothetical protein
MVEWTYATVAHRSSSLLDLLRHGSWRKTPAPEVRSSAIRALNLRAPHVTDKIDQCRCRSRDEPCLHCQFDIDNHARCEVFVGYIYNAFTLFTKLSLYVHRKSPNSSKRFDNSPLLET